MQKYPIAELHRIAADFRHLRAEHKDEGPNGSWRRRQHAQLTDMEERFEALLAHWIHDSDARQQWHTYFYRGSPEPPEVAVEEPPIFKGRSNGGADVVIREGTDGQLDVIVNGNVIERYASQWALGSEKLAPLAIAGFLFEEAFAAAEPAKAALLRFVTEPEGVEPPWQWAWELLQDGLIDMSFGLTPRGRRFIAAQRT